MKAWEKEFVKRDAELIHVRERAQNLMYEHGLIHKGWVFQWDNAKCRYGSCWTSKRKITLSYIMVKLNPLTETIETILHEIAHALTPSERGHGPEWKRKALSIGCNGERCHNADMALSKYISYCANCGKEKPRYRKPRKSTACGDCCRKYNNGEFSYMYELEIRIR